MCFRGNDFIHPYVKYTTEKKSQYFRTLRFLSQALLGRRKSSGESPCSSQMDLLSIHDPNGSNGILASNPTQFIKFTASTASLQWGCESTAFVNFDLFSSWLTAVRTPPSAHKLPVIRSTRLEFCYYQSLSVVHNLCYTRGMNLNFPTGMRIQTLGAIKNRHHRWALIRGNLESSYSRMLR